MYATSLKVRCHYQNCGDGPRLNELIESMLKGEAMDKWEESLGDLPVSCLGPGLAFVEPQITAEQVGAVRAGL